VPFLRFTLTISLVGFIVSLLGQPTSWSRVIASSIFSVSLIPMNLYLAGKGGQAPLFEVTTLLYGLFYGFAALLPFAPSPRMAGVGEESLQFAALLALAGIVFMILAFYGGPDIGKLIGLPRSTFSWSERRANFAAVIMGVAGFIAHITIMMDVVPLTYASILTFVSRMGLVAIGIFYCSWLEGRLERRYQLILGGLLIFRLIVSFSFGVLGDFLQLLLLSLVLYVALRRRFPWIAFTLVLVVGFPLQSFKTAYRRDYVYEGTIAMGTRADVIARGIDFLRVTSDAILTADAKAFEDAAEVSAQRLNLLQLFGYLVEFTPSRIPFFGGETYRSGLWKLVPRIIVPNKPQEQWGNAFGHIYGLIDSNDFTTSVNLPQLAETYVNFGLLGTVVGMFSIGCFYRIVCWVFNGKLSGRWGLIAGSVLFIGMMNIESNLLLVFGNVIQSAVLLYFMGFSLQ